MSQIHTFAFAVDYGTFTKIVPIDVPKNCIKYAENAVLSAHANEPKMPKILPNVSLYVGKNLHKMKDKTRLQCVAEALQKTFY
jgi:hypothetical protein